MSKRRLAIAVAAVVVVAGSALTTVSFGGGGGAIANRVPGRYKILHSGYTTPMVGHYSEIGSLSLPVGSWVVNAETVIQLGYGATQGTAVECYLTGPNAVPQYTATVLTPKPGTNLSSLSATLPVNAPDGGTVELLCRTNNRADSLLATARGTELVATPVPSVSISIGAPSS